MGYPVRTLNDQRRERRVGCALQAQISIGSQLSIHGQLKDLSLKSAFIVMKSSLYLQTNDAVTFEFQPVNSNDPSNRIQGEGRISRISAGEGMAIYFTRMEESSTNRLKNFLEGRTVER
jgi:hypothetical protein